MRINENDKVLICNPEGVLACFDGKIGTVKRIYPEVLPPLALVEFEDDEAVAASASVKVAIENLAKVEIEIRAGIPEGAKEISRADFKEALMSVTHPDNIFTKNSPDPMHEMLRGMVTMIVGDAVGDAVFKDKDSVIITENDFVSVLWDACSPVAVSERIGKSMPVSKCFTVSMGALFGMEEVVEILFGGSDD